MKIKNKITKFKRKALKNIFGAFSLSTALFIFQACYGTNQDFEPELSIRGTVRAENTAEPIPGIKVSLDKHRQYDFTDENGQFVIYTASGGQKQFTTLLGDTTHPTTKIKIIRTSTGEDVTAAGIWLRADNYTIEFEDSDEAGGSGLKSCEYYINSCDMDGTNCTTPVVSLTARNNNWSFDITAGKTAPIYNLEGAGRYYIYSGTTDNADNSGIDYKYLNFDFTPPETRIE